MFMLSLRFFYGTTGPYQTVGRIAPVSILIEKARPSWRKKRYKKSRGAGREAASGEVNLFIFFFLVMR